MTTSTGISGIRAVSIPVDDQDAALTYYTGTLGFTTLVDARTPTGARFLQLSPGTDAVSITLEPATPATPATERDGNTFSVTE